MTTILTSSVIPIHVYQSVNPINIPFQCTCGFISYDLMVNHEMIPPEYISCEKCKELYHLSKRIAFPKVYFLVETLTPDQIDFIQSHKKLIVTLKKSLI